MTIVRRRNCKKSMLRGRKRGVGKVSRKKRRIMKGGIWPFDKKKKKKAKKAEKNFAELEADKARLKELENLGDILPVALWNERDALRLKLNSQQPSPTPSPTPSPSPLPQNSPIVVVENDSNISNISITPGKKRTKRKKGKAERRTKKSPSSKKNSATSPPPNSPHNSPPQLLGNNLFVLVGAGQNNYSDKWPTRNSNTNSWGPGEFPQFLPITNEGLLDTPDNSTIWVVDPLLWDEDKALKEQLERKLKAGDKNVNNKFYDKKFKAKLITDEIKQKYARIFIITVTMQANITHDLGENVIFLNQGHSGELEFDLNNLAKLSPHDFNKLKKEVNPFNNLRHSISELRNSIYEINYENKFPTKIFTDYNRIVDETVIIDTQLNTIQNNKPILKRMFNFVVGMLLDDLQTLRYKRENDLEIPNDFEFEEQYPHYVKKENIKHTYINLDKHIHKFIFSSTMTSPVVVSNTPVVNISSSSNNSPHSPPKTRRKPFNSPIQNNNNNSNEMSLQERYRKVVTRLVKTPRSQNTRVKQLRARLFELLDTMGQ